MMWVGCSHTGGSDEEALAMALLQDMPCEGIQIGKCQQVVEGAVRRGLGVLLVDDNVHVADALRLKLSQTPKFYLAGWLPDASGLAEWAQANSPDLAIVDIDMPGPDIFEVMAQLLKGGATTRVVVFSGLVTRELIDRAIESGAWGYASKNDGEHELIQVLSSVGSGDVAFSTEAIAACNSI